MAGKNRDVSHKAARAYTGSKPNQNQCPNASCLSKFGLSTFWKEPPPVYAADVHVSDVGCGARKCYTPEPAEDRQFSQHAFALNFLPPDFRTGTDELGWGWLGVPNCFPCFLGKVLKKHRKSTGKTCPTLGSEEGSIIVSERSTMLKRFVAAAGEANLIVSFTGLFGSFID